MTDPLDEIQDDMGLVERVKRFCKFDNICDSRLLCRYKGKTQECWRFELYDKYPDIYKRAYDRIKKENA